MASIIPTTVDYSKEGLECYIDSTTIDFNEPGSSELYANLCFLAKFNHLGTKITIDLYNRSVRYTDSHEAKWERVHAFERLRPMMYDIASILGINKDNPEISLNIENIIFNESEEYFNKKAEEIFTEEVCDLIVYIYNRITVRKLEKIAKNIDIKEAIENSDYTKIGNKIIEILNIDTSKVEFEFVKPKYNKFLAKEVAKFLADNDIEF